MKKSSVAALAVLTLGPWVAAAHAQVTDTRETIAYGGAKQIVDTCMEMAKARHWPIAIWVLDASGQPVYFASMGAREVGVTTARQKAETALRLGAPSEAAGLSMPVPAAQAIGLFQVAGGIPLVKDGRVIGAVGGGGGKPENGQSVDQICAQAGIDAAFKK